MFSALRARLRLRSVRARLTFWYLLTLGASLLAFATFVFLVRARALYLELDADLAVRTHQAATELRPALFALDVAGEVASRPPAAVGALIVRATRGPILFRAPDFPRIDWTGQRRLAAAAQDATALVTVSDRDGASVRVATLVVDRPGADTLAIQVAAPTEPVRHVLRRLAAAMLVAIALVLTVASYGSGFTARRALAPVDEIVARVRRVQAAQAGERLDVRAGSAELDRLVATLNEMLDRIEASVRAARRFAADASHELQTPLAAMRAAVEACLRGDRRSADYHSMAADLLAEIERCSALVRDLRLLALAEAGQVVAAGERVDVAGVTLECAEIARAMAEQKRISVETHIVDRPIIVGNTLHLRRVILNVADNALRYSPRDSTVQIRVACSDGAAQVSVRDWGCGIDAIDLPHIFEPFYRADPARARDTGGTGLGLAIADQIVRAHGGRIAVASEPGAGSTFTVSLPVAPVSAPEVAA